MIRKRMKRKKRKYRLWSDHVLSYEDDQNRNKRSPKGDLFSAVPV
jgi:hypothetical protein